MRTTTWRAEELAVTIRFRDIQSEGLDPVIDVSVHRGRGRHRQEILNG